MRHAVIGAGAWGTTLAILLRQKGYDVVLWERDAKLANRINEEGCNEDYLPNAPFPGGLRATNDLDEAVSGKDMVTLAVPSQFARRVVERIDPSKLGDAALVSVAKGIENKTLMTVTQIARDVLEGLPPERIAALSGPSHAEEVVKKIPTAVVAASESKHTAEAVQRAFMTPAFRVYSTDDLLGVELGGAFKNVIAVGAGIIDGLGLGDNTKAAIMTRGVAEIARLGTAMGARQETFAGLSGIGDFFVTCTSRHSRNRRVGEMIGSGMTLAEAIESMKAVAEGVDTSRSAVELSERSGVETPITREVYRTLFEGKDPLKATQDLMTRTMKSE
ncbi:MAG: NAD(P)H-dependent glycerol-3-phosphate dehydrogenase [Ignavibacteriales bacterium]|nr:NAD(P)H-dependent glycerol-3-phosphate dehydrogenase [Ignavibacteriales bacterium]